ncbi:MAG: phage protein GemA/Gp16 family protein [Pseudomonadota bacterium]
MDKATRRRLLLGLAHKGAMQVGMDDDTRRAAQLAFGGHESLRDYSDQQLIKWCYELKRRGADIGVPAPPPRGGSGWDRPSAPQWARIEQLSAQLGLTEVGLAQFVTRTAKVDDPRFLTKAQATAVITALAKWAGGRSPASRSAEREARDAMNRDGN